MMTTGSEYEHGWNVVSLDDPNESVVHRQIERISMLGKAARILHEDLAGDESLSVFALPTGLEADATRVIVQATYDIVGVLDDYGSVSELYRPSLFYEARRNEDPPRFGIPPIVEGFKSRIIPEAMFGYMRIVNLDDKTTYSLGAIDNNSKTNYVVNLSPAELDQ